MDYDKEAKSRINSLDHDIEKYVDSIIPMLIPDDATRREKEKLRRILKLFTSLDVYADRIRKIEKTGNTSGIESSYNFGEIEMIKMWNILEKTTPYMPIRKLLLHGNNSRYAKKRWRNDKEGLSLTDPKRVLVSYTKRLKNTVSEKAFFASLDWHPQIEAALAIREIFHNGGALNVFDLEDDGYKALENFVQELRTTLEGHMREVLRFSQYPNKTNIQFYGQPIIERETHYSEACEYAKQFLSIGKLRTYSQSAKIASKRRKEQRITDKEYKRIIHEVVELFDSEFSYLPANEQQHEKYMEAILEKINRHVVNYGGMERTYPEQYTKFAKKLYRKYMTQLKLGILPLRLSYHEEDKEIYSSIVEEAREQQKYERINGIHRVVLDAQQAVVLSMIAITVIGYTLGDSILRGDATIPMAELAGFASAALIKKLCDNRRLYMDVEKRLSIKGRRILPYRIDRTIHPEKYKSTNERESEEMQAQEASIFKNIEYVEIPSAEVSRTEETPQIPSQISQGNHSPRRRRSDRYKTVSLAVEKEAVEQTDAQRQEENEIIAQPTTIRRRRSDRYKNKDI